MALFWTVVVKVIQAHQKNNTAIAETVFFYFILECRLQLVSKTMHGDAIRL